MVVGPPRFDDVVYEVDLEWSDTPLPSRRMTALRIAGASVRGQAPRVRAVRLLRWQWVAAILLFASAWFVTMTRPDLASHWTVFGVPAVEAIMWVCVYAIVAMTTMFVIVTANQIST